MILATGAHEWKLASEAQAFTSSAIGYHRLEDV